MLIEFVEDIVEVLKSKGAIKKKHIRIINGILKTMINQQHIVIADIYQLEKMIEYSFIDDDNKIVLNWLINHYSEIMEISEKISCKIKVVASADDITYHDNDIIVPLERMEKISDTIISAENKKDADLYIGIADRFISYYNMNNFIGLNFKKHSYCGGNCETVLAEIFEKPNINPICLCIVDSDKEYEKHKGGETSRKARGNIEKYKKNHITEVHELGVREKENLIPPSFYKYCCRQYYGQFAKMENLENSDNNILKFYDIKEGILVKNYLMDDAEWHKIYDVFLQFCESNGILKCPLTELKYKEENSSCIWGVGDKMAEIFLDNILQKNIIKIYNDKLERKNQGTEIPESELDFYKEAVELSTFVISRIPTYLEEEWKRLYNILLNWGCVITDIDFWYL